MSLDQIHAQETVLACNLNAIAADQLDHHYQTVRQVFAAIQEINVLPTGYAFRLPTDSDILLKAAEFIANERLCCSFFEFSLTVTPNGGPIWLQLMGGEDIREFINAEFLQIVTLP